MPNFSALIIIVLASRKSTRAYIYIGNGLNSYYIMYYCYYCLAENINCSLQLQMAGYALFFLICSSNLAAGAVVYQVTPNSDDSCTMPCSNLSLFSANFSSFFSFQNTTVVLLPGKHYLSTQLQVFDQNHFVMVSLNTTAQVVCEDTSLISFNSTRLI